MGAIITATGLFCCARLKIKYLASNKFNSGQNHLTQNSTIKNGAWAVEAEYVRTKKKETMALTLRATLYYLLLKNEISYTAL